MSGTPDEVGKLLAFVVGITALLVVVPAAVGLAGVDIRDGSLPWEDEDATEFGTNETLLVLSAHGYEVDDEGTSVGVVELLVAPAGEEEVDLDRLRVTWTDHHTVELTPRLITGGDASFDAESLHSERVLRDASDRAVVRFDLGSDDVEGLEQFGARLEPGDEVTVRFEADGEVYAERKLLVPDPLPSGPAVRLW